MKKSIFVLVVALFASAAMFAQKPVKLGHIDAQELIKIMPEVDSITKVLQAEQEEAESMLKTMAAELQQLQNDYVAKRDQMSDLIKQTKEAELQDKNARIQNFAEQAQKRLQERNEALFAPIQEKIKNAIAKVAKANGYTYIFTSGATLYEGGDDILPLVKKELGLK
ncbi:MAG: OmpH family outer membrane protein [Bacteroidales bacterium]|nr:OmpH family outer membrane protein [Bacteroidales bacterium]